MKQDSAYKLIYINRKAWLTLGFFFIYSWVPAQSKTYLDSIESVYLAGTYTESDKLKLLRELAIKHSDTERKLFFSEELIQSARSLDSLDYLIQGLQEKGNALSLKSNLTNALESYFEAAKLVGEEGQSAKLGSLYTGIAGVYAIMGNHSNAVNYYQRAINILRSVRDSTNLAAALLNIGDEFITKHRWDSALIYTEEAGVIYENTKSPIGEAYSLGNLGMIYAQIGDDRKAEGNMNRAILLLERLDEHYPIAVYLTYIADIYLEKGENDQALNYALRSLELAKKNGLKAQVSDANLKISEIYQQAGKLKESFIYYKNHIAYKDSVSNITSVQQMADLRTDFEISKKQIEVDLLNQQKKNQQIIVVATVIALFLICLLAIGLYRRYTFTKETNRIIEKERERSDSLLLNILPKETAQELKLSGKVKAKKFEAVSVLFADFKGFTKYAEELSPEQLVERVDFYFSKFDTIIEKYGLEKIKTIGDAYMCAGGLPFTTDDHAYKTVCAAQEMMSFVEVTKKSSSADQRFDIRIGINTGPVVAGVVGTKKFAYDIWGDTVNIAARMESNSVAGKINVSENTYDLIKDSFQCAYRGEIEAKNKGTLRMYFVGEAISKSIS